MKYNKQAFNGIDDLKYKNWDGYSASYTYDFIKVLENYLDLESIETIFDIGSRDACQSLEFSDWFPESKIYLFEPIASSFNYCVNNTKNRTNIICNKLALGDFNGTTSFYEVVNGNVGASSLLKVTPLYSHFYQKEITVDIMKASTFIETNNIDKIDLLWVDVQGAEINCFSGFEKHLKNVKAIHTEVGLQAYYESGTDFETLMNFMNKNNFTNVKIITNRDGLEVDIIFINNDFLK